MQKYTFFFSHHMTSTLPVWMDVTPFKVPMYGPIYDYSGMILMIITINWWQWWWSKQSSLRNLLWHVPKHIKWTTTCLTLNSIRKFRYLNWLFLHLTKWPEPRNDRQRHRTQMKLILTNIQRRLTGREMSPATPLFNHRKLS